MYNQFSGLNFGWFSGDVSFSLVYLPVRERGVSVSRPRNDLINELIIPHRDVWRSLTKRMYRKRMWPKQLYRRREWNGWNPRREAKKSVFNSLSNRRERTKWKNMRLV